MHWDLYVDESGKFDQGEKCLVGGFLCPHDAVSREMILAWKREITSDAHIRQLMQVYPNWKFDHCTENSVTSPDQRKLRQEIQCCILEEYSARLDPLGAKFIIFNNPSGSYNVDNTTNFLTVLAKGLLLFFYDRRDEIESLHLHFASRKNVTMQDNPEDLPVSPTRVNEPGKTDKRTILASQYKNQIRNLAFLQGGAQLLEDPVFSDMLDSMEILSNEQCFDEKHDIFYIPNPVTVPCDYICNTYLNISGTVPVLQDRIADLYSAEHCLYYQVDLPTKIIRREDWSRENVSGAQLMELISLDLPEPVTSHYFDDFNTVAFEIQRAVIIYVREALKTYVTGTCAMEQMAERLEHTIDAAERMEEDQIRHEFIANLLLFLRSLCTHMGRHDDIERITDRFHEEVAEIQDSEITEDLYNIADNSWIVYLTDCFDPEQAMKEFAVLSKDWESRVNGRIRSRGRQSREIRKFPVYGRTIGSYLQTLRSLIHLGDENKELYYSEATDWYQRGRDHLSDPKDLCRYHQNVCDIESEMAHFQEAFDHLYIAAVIMEDEEIENRDHIPVTLENAAKILSNALENQDLGMNPFILQHYARMLSQIWLHPSFTDMADILFKAYQPYLDQEVWSKIGNTHARTQILWKTASYLAGASGTDREKKRLASDLFALCTQQLEDAEEPVFSAIAVGVLSEQIWHIEHKNIQGNSSVCWKTLRSFYQSFLETRTPATRDPFDHDFLMKNKVDFINEQDRFRQMSLRIGY